ncbi:MAG: hypothetical protein AAGA54_07600 [Myxococcota bacterium]
MLLSAFTAGIYYFIWLANVGNDLRAKAVKVPPWWYLLVPILGFVYLWKVAKGAEAVTRGQTSAGTTMALLCIFPPLGAFLTQKGFNALALSPSAAA